MTQRSYLKLKKLSTVFYILSFILLSVSCSTLVKVPETEKEISSKEALNGWNAVLHDYVNEQGQINFQALAKNQKLLKNYVNYISKVGPRSKAELFPTPQAKLAHYLNSYNALSMYNILDSEIPESLSGLKKVKFFYFKKFIIDGEEMSLYTYENSIIRKQGEERVHFALNCMSKGCPRLPRKAFTAEHLELELNQNATYFFSETRNVGIDEEKKQVLLSEILDFFPEDFLKKAPSLIAYANRYRSANQKLPESYKVKFIPYDWMVNAQPIPKNIP